MAEGQEVKYVCDQPRCRKGFPTTPDLLTHMMEHVRTQKEKYPNREFMCPICLQTFVRGIDVDRHIVIHKDDFCYQCPICLEGFHKCAQIRIHMNQHNDRTAFKCTLCKDTFATSDEFLIHRRLKHYQPGNEDEAFDCLLCGKRFMTFHGVEHHFAAPE